MIKRKATYFVAICFVASVCAAVSHAQAGDNCKRKDLVISNHGPRRFLVDTEKGIAAAYVLFAGGLLDCHMFKMVNGKVELILAVVGAGSKTMGWPDEPAE